MSETKWKKSISVETYNHLKKQTENYKNIELLKNIYEVEPLSHPSSPLSHPSSPLSHPSSPLSHPYPLSHPSSEDTAPPIIEPAEFDPIPGNDKPNISTSNKENVKNAVRDIRYGLKTAIEFIGYPITHADQNMNRWINGFIDAYKKVSKSKTITPDDKKWSREVIKSQLYSILSIPLCLYITYNWYYLLFYRNENCDRVLLPNIYDKFTENTVPSFQFFFEFTMLVPELINHFIISSGDYLVKYADSSPFIAFVLLFMIVFANFNTFFFASGDLISGFAQGNTTSMTGPVMIVTMILIFNYYIKHFLVSSIFGAPSFISIFIALFRAILGILLAPIAGLITCLYLILYSYFGMNIFDSTGHLFNAAALTMSKINKYIYTSIFSGINGEKEGETDEYEKFKNASWMNIISRWLNLNNVIKHIFFFLFEVISIFILLNGVAVYSQHIKNADLKIAMILFNIILILGGIIVMYLKYTTNYVPVPGVDQYIYWPFFGSMEYINEIYKDVKGFKSCYSNPDQTMNETDGGDVLPSVSPDVPVATAEAMPVDTNALDNIKSVSDGIQGILPNVTQEILSKVNDNTK